MDHPSPNFSPSEVASYYRNRPLMWRNLSLILLLTLGWSASFTVVTPIIQLRLNGAGVAEGGMGLISAINSWIYCYAVMYFAWKSDHTVSRFGRRIPYLFVSAPIIISVLLLFPLIDVKWVLIGLAILQALFMDIKAATIPLLNVDCMPRNLLARTAAPSAIIVGILSFIALRYGMKLGDWSENLPYFLVAGILTATTLIGGYGIKEPPIQDPTTEKFRPWSAMKVALRDRRKLLLMFSVSLLQTFQVVFANWIWLYAKNVMHLSRAETGMLLSWGILLSVVMAFPCGWLIDRISPYKLIPAFCFTAALATWFVLHIHKPTDLIIAAGLSSLLSCLYGAADIMVYRNADPAEVGSVTSTNSCIRGIYMGSVLAFLGFLIEKSGQHYEYAFIVGCGMTFAGLIPLYCYRHLMRSTPTPQPAVPVALENPSSL